MAGVEHKHTEHVCGQPVATLIRSLSKKLVVDPLSLSRFQYDKVSHTVLFLAVAFFLSSFLLLGNIRNALSSFSVWVREHKKFSGSCFNITDENR